MRQPPPGTRRAWHRSVRCVLLTFLITGAAVAAPAPVAAQQSCGPTGNVTLDSSPWPLQRLAPDAAWPLSRGRGAVVAVIDSGVSASHPALAGQVRPGRDFGLPGRSGHCDEAGHGTLVAGIIAGRGDTGVPYAGIAPEATILPVRVLRDVGPSTDPGLPGRVATAIRWAVDNGADVINLSLVTVRTRELADAVAYARDHDVVLVAAAGNVAEGEQSTPAYPAAFEEVLAVAGVDRAGGHVDTSVRGEYLDVAAPGADIIGPAPNGAGYRQVPEGGTSYATAYVSGVAALVRARYPDLTAVEVMQRVRLTADRPASPAGHDDRVGHGVVNPYRAVSTVLGVRDNPTVAPVRPRPIEPDPLAWHRSVASWTALGGGVLAVLLLLGRSVARAGRQRGWRPPPRWPTR